MFDSKTVISQVQELQVIIQVLLEEDLIVNEALQVVAIIDKLPPPWKEFKNYLKHKRKKISVEDLIVRLRVEEDNKEAEKRSKGNFIINDSNIVVDDPKNSKKCKKESGQQCNPPKKKFKGNYFICGKADHKFMDCRLPKKDKKKDQANIAETKNEVDHVYTMPSKCNLVGNPRDCWIDSSATRHIQATPVKRLCKTHNTITVNGQFPGPTLEVNNGDTLVVNVVNRARYNVTIHWHGVRQMRTAWADGPEFITQCPIRPGKSYTYRFTIQGQEGTLWWHAHSSWLRATVYGALIIHPKEGENYPFPKPKRETPILLGEWWDKNPIDVVRQATRTGAAPNVSDAYTFNGQPGDLYKCSSQDTTVVHMDSGDTNLLRVINAGLNQQLFFTVANHKFTVVGADASYVKPFTTSVLMLGPGQTTDVLIKADQPAARYYMAARAYASAQGAPFDNTTTTAILEYKTASCSSNCVKSKPVFPSLPAYNDTATATAFTTKFRSPRKVEVPTEIDENLFITVGLGLNNCSSGARSRNCQGPNGTRFTASMNNVSFVLPSNFSLLQAHHKGIPGVFSTDFPAVPPVKFDYTGNVSRSLWQPTRGTRLYNLKYGARVQVVLQGTSIFTAENHPIHLHGYDFYIIAEGFGNFNPKTDTAKFNLVDPPLRNTASVPVNGWTVIRFVADNPGVWLMHCHLDVHITWGLAMAFLVENGISELESLEAPPEDLPVC
ncbi:Laccase-5 [Capsicum chinense]|nr:Laccase-5 [Capsicum chinense]